MKKTNWRNLERRPPPKAVWLDGNEWGIVIVLLWMGFWYIGLPLLAP